MYIDVYVHSCVQICVYKDDIYVISPRSIPFAPLNAQAHLLGRVAHLIGSRTLFSALLGPNSLSSPGLMRFMSRCSQKGTSRAVACVQTPPNAPTTPSLKKKAVRMDRKPPNPPLKHPFQHLTLVIRCILSRFRLLLPSVALVPHEVEVLERQVRFCRAPRAEGVLQHLLPVPSSRL